LLKKIEPFRDQPAALHNLLDSAEASLSIFNSSFHQNLKKGHTAKTETTEE